MLVMAAHTGARRSELCRSRVADFQFDAGVVLIRERKRIQGHRSTRQVSLSPLLESTMKTWIDSKRDSVFTFPSEFKVERNRKARENDDAVSADEASHHLSMALVGTRWSMIRGWHIFRHSFCSNLAAAGVDQRLINAWVGHQTDAMVRRYRHLIPDQQRQAIRAVFGE
jgi:integrase